LVVVVMAAAGANQQQQQQQPQQRNFWRKFRLLLRATTMQAIYVLWPAISRRRSVFQLLSPAAR
jgi:hypothetical protein